jgi:hypothetical protein
MAFRRGDRKNRTGHDASLIITGLSKHGLLDRLVGGETAGTRVAQLSRLASAAYPRLQAASRCDVVVAMDLDPLHWPS